MGITTEEFFENIYSVIFSPRAFFKREDLKISIRLAFGTIVFIALVGKVASGIFEGSILSVNFIFSLMWHIITTIVLWLLTALFFEYTAKIYDRAGKFSKLLYLTAFAPVPYIFFAPLNLLKQTGGTGYILAANIELLLYLWIIILYAFSLRAAYNITLSRSFMLIFLPFISSFFAIYWLISFFLKIWYIFSI